MSTLSARPDPAPLQHFQLEDPQSRRRLEAIAELAVALSGWPQATLELGAGPQAEPIARAGGVGQEPGSTEKFAIAIAIGGPETAPRGALTLCRPGGSGPALPPETRNALELLADQARAILELDQSQAELQRVLARKRVALRAGGVGIWRVDLASGACIWSEEQIAIFGVDARTFRPGLESFVACVHPSDRERLRAICEEAARGERTGKHDYRLVRPDGEIRFVQGSIDLIRDAEGRPRELVGTTVDVTRESATSEALRDKAEVIESFFDTVPLMMGIGQIEGGQIRPVSENRRLREFFGLGPDNALRGLSSERGVPPEITDLWCSAALESEAIGKPVRFEYVHPSAAGDRRLLATVNHISRAEGGRSRISYVCEDVTDQRSAQLQARRAEMMKKAIVDAALDCIVSIDLEGRILEFNPTAERVFGYRREEAIGRDMAELIMPERLRSRHHAGMARFAREGGPAGPAVGRRIESTAVRKDGTEFPIELAVSAFDVNGVLYFAAYIRDLSDQVRTRRELQSSHEMYSSLVNGLREVVFQTDLGARLTFLNPAWEDVTGFLLIDSIGEPLVDFVFPEDRQLALDKCAALLAGRDESCRLTLRYRTRSGQFRWVEINARAYRDAAGALAGVAGTLLDVHERKIAAEDLYETKTFLSTVLDHLPVALFCKDATQGYQYTLWNHAAERLFGIKREGALGRTDHDFFPKDEADFFRAKDRETMQNGAIVDIPEEPVTSSSGDVRTLHTVKVPVPDRQGRPRYLLGISEDITERKKAEIRLVQSSKMSSLGEMAGGIAHEINNPLAIIHGRAAQFRAKALRGEVDAPSAAAFAEKIEQTASRIARIVRGLRSFARDGERDPMTPQQVQTIVAETVEFCQERFRNHSIELRVAEIPAELQVSCRSSQISQVLLNLLNNAYDAVLQLPERWVEVSARQLGEDLVEIAVRDSGAGIPEAIRDRLMQPFFTTKDVGSGTGLGLSISKGIIESHRGQLKLDTASPNTRFVITLPRRQPASAPGEEAVA